MTDINILVRFPNSWSFIFRGMGRYENKVTIQSTSPSRPLKGYTKLKKRSFLLPVLLLDVHPQFSFSTRKLLNINIHR